MSDNHNLYHGPMVDGRETFFAQGQHVPEGWEYRSSAAYTFGTGETASSRRWVQCRRPQVESVIVGPDGRERNVTFEDVVDAIQRVSIGLPRATDADAAIQAVWRLLTEGE